MTSPEGNKSSDQPDLGKAAKDFWAAAKAKAKEVGGKAAEKARDVGAKAIEEAKHVQDTGQPGKAPTDPASNLKGKALDVWRRAPTLVVVCGVGILVLCSSCCICTGLFSLASGTRGTPMASRDESPAVVRDVGTSLGLSQDKFLRPTHTSQLESLVAEVGHPLKLVRDDKAVRIWSGGKKTQLAVTGPRDSLTGVFVLCGFSTNDKDNATSLAVTACSLRSLFNRNLGSVSESNDESGDTDDVIRWFTSLLEQKKSGQRMIGNLRIGFQNCAPISYQVSIQPRNGQIDPIDVFGLGQGAKLLLKPTE